MGAGVAWTWVHGDSLEVGPRAFAVRRVSRAAKNNSLPCVFNKYRFPNSPWAGDTAHGTTAIVPVPTRPEGPCRAWVVGLTHDTTRARTA
jgi:hypothetical protein